MQPGEPSTTPPRSGAPSGRPPGGGVPPDDQGTRPTPPAPPGAADDGGADGGLPARAVADAVVPGAGPADERVRKITGFQRVMGRPESASIAGAVLVFAVFALTARDSGMFALDGVMNWSTVAAYLGILATGACLLMIAGEFDLSIGSMIGFAGMMAAIPPLYFGWPVWAAMAMTLVLALALGWLNGQIVVRTGLPSFIVTLAFLFILRGLTLAFSIAFANRTIVSGIGDLAAKDPVVEVLFYGTFGNELFAWMARHHWIKTLDDGVTPLVHGIPKVLLWWFVVAVASSFRLTRTRLGNWIFAVGGDATAAKNVGVPVRRVKVSLFMFTAFCAWLFAMLQICDVGSAAADRGLQKEFEAVIAAVIGGSLLTGGYGSVVGASFGALIFGVVQIGIGYTNVSSDWFRVFLGVMLLFAVLFNNQVRRRVTEARST
ncbi:ABC transporter permease [Anaeromyxobacter oryzae]|uniref:Xylose transport system permease protein XylH n=1 Tax=Anaeromyxobacter oryzae TaxID=2918170 RepID=A0ABM7X0W7_9BACT|nr:ABC transporter permease [Anaeromyxobacter oryzae]BDG05401.1 sugar ABC transporter permease [Anaeromyxobacter oryzae]